MGKSHLQGWVASPKSHGTVARASKGTAVEEISDVVTMGS